MLVTLHKGQPSARLTVFSCHVQENESVLVLKRLTTALYENVHTINLWHDMVRS